MSESIAPGKKRCTHCQQTKDINEFHRAKSCKDGYRSNCKECNKEKVKYQCRECKTIVDKADRIPIGPRTTYCAACWEAIKGKKKCLGCRVYKDISEFSEDKSRPDGHEYYCKDCRRGHQIDKYAREIIEKGTKRCMDCKITKNLSEFPRDGRARDGVGLFCTMCCNGEKVEEKPERDTRKKVALKLERRVVRKMRSLYGIDEAEYIEMHEQQKGLCAICGRPELSKRILSVDHNHETRKVRALLCNGCNTGLGMFEENSEYLQRAIKYLQEHE